MINLLGAVKEKVSNMQEQMDRSVKFRSLGTVVIEPFPERLGESWRVVVFAHSSLVVRVRVHNGRNS